MPEHILVVDDEQDLVDLVRYSLERDGYAVSTAANGHDALSQVGAMPTPPDLVLLDVMMPVMDGFETCRQLRARPATHETPILFLTAKDAEIDEIVGLELGADDYLRKPVSTRTLVARIRAALRRSVPAPDDAPIPGARAGLAPDGHPEVLRADGVVLDRGAYRVTVDGVEVPFARKEFEVLSLFMVHRGRVFTREQMLNRIWGSEVIVIDRTVDVHIRKVREKLGRYAGLIETIKGVGYRSQLDAG